MNSSVVSGEFRGDTPEVGEGTVVGTNLFALIVCRLTLCVPFLILIALTTVN